MYTQNTTNTINANTCFLISLFILYLLDIYSPLKFS